METGFKPCNHSCLWQNPRKVGSRFPHSNPAIALIVCPRQQIEVRRSFSAGLYPINRICPERILGRDVCHSGHRRASARWALRTSHHFDECPCPSLRIFTGTSRLILTVRSAVGRAANHPSTMKWRGSGRTPDVFPFYDLTMVTFGDMKRRRNSSRNQRRPSAS